MTYRLLPHSTADDPKKYRDEAEARQWEAREPLPRFRRYLEAKGLVDDALHARLEKEVDVEVRAAIERAEARMQAARPLAMFDHVYGNVPAEVVAQQAEFERELEGEAAANPAGELLDRSVGPCQQGWGQGSDRGPWPSCD